MPNQREFLLGKIGLQLGLYSEKQLLECLKHQNDVEPNKPLGAILIQKGYINDSALAKILQAQSELLGEKSEQTDERWEDALFGKKALKRGLITQEKLNEALRYQDLHSDENLRLGEVLLLKGILSLNQILEILATQKKTIVVCPACFTRYNILSKDSEDTKKPLKAKCKVCSTILEIPTRIDSPQVADEIVVSPKKILQKISRFNILSVIGEGGMGKVYEAFDTKLERKVAIKVLERTSGVSEINIERFKREAKILANLKHPNIVKLHEVGEQEDKHFIVMDLIDGVSLETLMKNEKLSPHKSAEIVLSVAEALRYAHDNAIIHRDVKPSNILIDKKNNAYLTDFGLAKNLNRKSLKLTMSGVLAGTPHYMSPEQASGEVNLDARTDIYSLGVVLYEMLTGSTPFKGTTLTALLYKIANEEPKPPKLVNHKISNELDCIVSKAISKEKERRYNTSAEFAQDLNRFLSGEPVLAKHPSVFYKILKKIEKNKTIIAIATGCVIIAVVVGIILGTHYKKEQTSPIVIDSNATKKISEVLTTIKKKILKGDYKDAQRIISETQKDNEVFQNISYLNYVIILKKDGLAKTIRDIKEKKLNESPQMNAFCAYLYARNSEYAVAKDFLSKIPENLAARSSELKSEIEIWKKLVIAIIDSDESALEKITTDWADVFLAKEIVYKKLKKIDKIRESLEKAVLLEPFSFDVLISYIKFLYEDGEFEKILDILSKSTLKNEELTVFKSLSSFYLGRYQEAILQIYETEGEETESLGILLARVEILRFLGKLDEALGNANLAVKLDSANFRAHYLKGIVLEAKNDLQSAYETQISARKLNTQSPDVNLAIVRILWKQKKFGEAKDFFKDYVFEDFLKESPVRFTIGTSKSYVDELVEQVSEDMISKFNFSKIDEKDFVDCAFAAIRLKKYDIAADVIEAGLKKFSNSYRLFNSKGVFLKAMKRHIQAIDAFKEALSINPEDIPTYCELADTYLSVGDIGNASITLSEALRINPNNKRLISSLIQTPTKSTTRDYQEKMMNKLISKGEPNGYLLRAFNSINQIRELEQKGEMNNITLELDEFDFWYPGTIFVNTLKANLYRKLNIINDAIKELEKARSIDKEDISVTYVFALCYKQKNNLAEAEKFFESVLLRIEANEDDVRILSLQFGVQSINIKSDLYINLADCYVNTNKPAKAIELLEKSIDLKKGVEVSCWIEYVLFAKAHRLLKDYDKAWDYVKKSHRLFKDYLNYATEIKEALHQIKNKVINLSNIQIFIVDIERGKFIIEYDFIKNLEIDSKKSFEDIMKGE